MLRHCDTQVSHAHHHHNKEQMGHWFAGGKIKPSHQQRKTRTRAMSHFMQNEVFYFSQCMHSRDPREVNPNVWINQCECMSACAWAGTSLTADVKSGWKGRKFWGQVPLLTQQPPELTGETWGQNDLQILQWAALSSFSVIPQCTIFSFSSLFFSHTNTHSPMFTDMCIQVG